MTSLEKRYRWILIEVPKQKRFKLTDLSLINGKRNGRTSFAIQKLDSKIFNDDMAAKLEDYFNDNGIFADMFNVEYMGFLTGEVRIESSKIELIIPILNKYFKQ